MIAKPERHRCPAHLRWVATIPCLVCSRGALPRLAEWEWENTVSQAHHLTHAQPKARGLKAGDQWVVPLCVAHHDPNHSGSVHANGAERAWWAMKGVDPLPIAEALWAASVAAGRVRNIERKAA